MMYPDTTPDQPNVRIPLPGKAVGAAVLGFAYGGLSVIGIFQILAVMNQLRSSERSIATIAIVITVIVIALLLIGSWMVIKQASRLPLLIGAAISLFLAIFSLQQGVNFFTLLNLGASVGMVVLLNSAEVKEHFRR